MKLLVALQCIYCEHPEHTMLVDSDIRPLQPLGLVSQHREYKVKFKQLYTYCYPRYQDVRGKDSPLARASLSGMANAFASDYMEQRCTGCRQDNQSIQTQAIALSLCSASALLGSTHSHTSLSLQAARAASGH